MEEPGGRFASGLFRRTGGAGSVTARGGDRNVSGGLDPIPIQRHTAWATRLARLRGEPARPGLLPHCDASRARPSKKRPSRYSRAYACRQEQSENITLLALGHSPLPFPRRHGRARPGHPDPVKRHAGKYVPLSSPASRRRGKGIHEQAERFGFPSPAMAPPSPAGNDILTFVRLFEVPLCGPIMTMGHAASNSRPSWPAIVTA